MTNTTDQKAGALRGIIFDMDGVLVDSEKFICEAAMQMFLKKGLTVQPEDFLPFVGTGEDRYLGGVAEKYGLALELEEAKLHTYKIYGEIMHGRAKPLPGAPEFLRAARVRGLKLAVASAADRFKVDINLREIGIPAETFDAVVTGSEVTHKKPDPEIFLKAAEHLGLTPAQCLVVEDAVNGVEAACQGGFKSLGITTSFSIAQLHKANWHAPDLASTPKECLEW